MLVDAPSGIEVDEIASPSTFEELWPEWELLWQRSSSATPFQSPDWLVPWWSHFGGSDLWCLALRADGQLVGLAPFFVWERKLLFIGTGITDYLDVLIDPEWQDVGVAAIGSLLARQSQRLEECDLQQLPAESPLRTDDAVVQDVCPVLDLCGDEIPMLKKAEYYLRHATKTGEVLIEEATEDNFERCFSEFLRLHTLRWKEKGVLNQLERKAFHQEVASHFLRTGMLRLYVLYLSDQAIAAWYGFESKRRLYFYLSGFDPAFEKLSPGAILIGHAIKEARQAGARAFDFLRGQEPYKYLWGARDTLTYRRQIQCLQG
jgi:CelD/BcsL family acetyltransferase involved in cellulose biosynthesis